MGKILLGSQSPRRKEILLYFHLPFEIKAPDFDESSIAYQGNPEQLACKIAEGKGSSLASQFPNSTIITADTIVSYEKHVFFKPSDENEAFQMLKALSGKTHQVLTAVSVRLKKECYTNFGRTFVTFNHLTDKQIKQYLQTEEGKDKAGSYGGQEKGSLLIHSIDGSYDNMVGLPVNVLNGLLNQIGIDLWDYIAS